MFISYLNIHLKNESQASYWYRNEAKGNEKFSHTIIKKKYLSLISFFHLQCSYIEERDFKANNNNDNFLNNSIFLNE